MTIAQAIADAAAAANFGEPTARKAGRDPRWPYVPVIDETSLTDNGATSTRQLLGVAYATRDEAIRTAERHIAALRASLADRLANPRHRALREQYGLPSELPAERSGAEILARLESDGILRVIAHEAYGPLVTLANAVSAALHIEWARDVQRYQSLACRSHAYNRARCDRNAAAFPESPSYAAWAAEHREAERAHQRVNASNARYWWTLVCEPRTARGVAL